MDVVAEEAAAAILCGRGGLTRLRDGSAYVGELQALFKYDMALLTEALLSRPDVIEFTTGPPPRARSVPAPAGKGISVALAAQPLAAAAPLAAPAKAPPSRRGPMEPSPPPQSDSDDHWGPWMAKGRIR